jgi:hypothetical protein
MKSHRILLIHALRLLFQPCLRLPTTKSPRREGELGQRVAALRLLPSLPKQGTRDAALRPMCLGFRLRGVVWAVSAMPIGKK